MSLVSPSDLAKEIGMDKYGRFGTAVGWILMKVLELNKMNRFYDDIKHLEGIEFLDAIFNKLNVEFEIPENDLKRIPREGAFITVSNHPLGGLDGVLLLKLLLEQRKDFKTITSTQLERIEPLKPYFISIDPEKSKSPSAISGLKEALTHLSEGHALGIFPAGEVSTFREGKLRVDLDWDEGALKLIHKAKAPVIPVYFHAKNSRLFYILSKIHPKLKSAKLPSEVISSKRKTIKVRIGKPITLKMQEEIEDHIDLGEFIRKKTYLLANPFEKPKKKLRIKIGGNAKDKRIIDPVPVEKMIQEIKHMTEKGDKMFEKNQYQTFLSDSKDMPNILKEIGRLREITFREVGEGTGQAIDLDKYDKFYKHLLLWDSQEHKIVGAYRMGLGKEIYKKYGIKGFYTNELFRFEPELYDMMAHTIEMGRAFVVKKYQQKPFPLFLLWRGIVHTTLRHPEHKYLMGGVSISNEFSNFSKSLMIEFMKSHYYDPYTAQYIHPKKEFKVKLKDADKDFVFDDTQADLKKFDRIISELEPGELKIPVLLKKYIKQNARLIAFNVDPNFNDAIDGLMYIKIDDLPEETVQPVLEEFEAELLKKTNNE